MGRDSKKKQSSAAAGKPASAQFDIHRSVQTTLLYRPIAHLLLIGILGFIIYSNTFHSPFQWDETDYIVENPIVRDLGFFGNPSKAAGLPLYDALKSRYIGYLTFALNYKLHGVRVVGYHVVNLAIHLINAVLVYFLVLLTFRTPFFRARGEGQEGNHRGIAPTDDLRAFDHSLFTTHYSRFVALAAALLFVAHPVQTEAVTYVFQRLASLVTMFYLLSLVLYINGRLSSGQAGKLASYFLSLLCAILAMKTKENAFTLPVVIMLYEFLFFTGSLKARALRLTPFLLTMLIIPATMLSAESTAGEIISQIKNPASFGYEKISGGAYLLTQFRVIVTYIRLLFLPINQNIGYDYPLYHTLFTPPVLLSLVFLAVILGTGVYLIYKSGQAGASKGKGLKANGKDILQTSSASGSDLSPLAFSPLPYFRLAGFGILWFFITLSVESSIIPIPMVIDEYRVYLPSVGFFIAVLTGILLLLNRSSRFTIHDSRFTKTVAAVFGVIIVLLASATYARNSLWKDKITLWEDVVSKSPALATAHNNLGLAYKDRGFMERAIEQYRISMRLNPDFSLAYMNLGNVLDAEGRIDEAIGEYEKAARLAPDNWMTHLNLGNAYGKKGWSDRAVEQLDASLKLNPYSEASYNDLGNVYLQEGETAKAIDSYKEALRLNPNYADAYFNLGATYEEKGDLAAAIEQYREALRNNPDYIKAHYNLGGVYLRTGHLDEAIEQLGAAVRLSPANASYLNTLGVLYGRKGLYEEAIARFQEAIRLVPDNPSFRRNLERAQLLKDKK